jgi:hypothetical protein
VQNSEGPQGPVELGADRSDLHNSEMDNKLVVITNLLSAVTSTKGMW